VRIGYRVAALGIVSLSCLAVAAPAIACSYLEFPTLTQSVDRSDAIFFGRILRVSIADPRGPETEAIIEARIAVNETFKGESIPSRLLYSWEFGPGNCTNPLLVGMSCVFFVTPQEGRPFLEHLGFGCLPQGKAASSEDRASFLNYLSEIRSAVRNR